MFAEAGDHETLCFAPGRYDLTGPLEIRALTGVTIRGEGAAQGDVVLDFFGQTSGDTGISATAMTDLTIENLTVIDAAAQDVFATGGSGITIRHVSAGWVRRVAPMTPGSYALYPVNTTNVVIEDSEAFGGADSGIYVGQTTNCAIRRNQVHDNVGGIEIENSTNCEVYDNTVEHNTAGILVFELPSLPLQGSTTSVHANRICSNNTPNFALPGTTVEGVPAGVGIMLMAANHVEVYRNVICDDESTGILVISYATSMMPLPMNPGTYDGFADHICLHDNTFSGNGTMPQGPIAAVQGQSMDALYPPAHDMDDILTDGVFNGPGQLCIDTTGTFRTADPASSFTVQSHERTPFTCACAPIPAIQL